MLPAKGTLVEHGEYDADVPAVYHHRIEHVWDAIATPEGLREWTSSIGDHRRTPSRAASNSYRPAGYHRQEDTRLGSAARVRIQWNIAPVPEMPRGEHAIFRYELIPQRPTPTHLLVTYRRITG